MPRSTRSATPTRRCGRRSSRFTDALALAAARTIREALAPALEREERAMQALIEASAIANLACGNSHLALIHALSSAPSVQLPHGYQNGVLLPYVADFNFTALSADAAAEVLALPQLLEEIGFEARFTPGELSDADCEAMVLAALANPFTANNIRPASEADLRGLLGASRA